MADRVILPEQFMAPNSCFFCHIDENEYENLFQLFNTLSTQNQGTIIWDKKNPVSGANTIPTQHEYIVCHSKGNVKLYRPVDRETILNKAVALVKKYGDVTQECRKEFRNWIKNNADLSGMERSYSEIDDEGRVYTSIHMGAPELRTDPKFFQPLRHPVTNEPCPVPRNGFSGTPEFMEELLAKGEIVFGKDETTQPRRKSYLEGHHVSELSSLISSGERGKHQMDALGLHFPYCHPVGLYEKLIWAVTTDGKGTTLDFFAGSGTNAHAVINLNRQDDGRAQIHPHWDGTSFRHRPQTARHESIYTEKWKDGKPVSRKSCLSQIIKYQRIESYEDALNNIEFTERENSLFGENLLGYLLGGETRESPTFLNLTELQNPFNYRLNIVDGLQTQAQPIDLPETFNYLIGISVQTRHCLYDDDRRYLIYRGTVRQKNVVIIWRETKGWEEKDWERDYRFIEENKVTEVPPRSTSTQTVSSQKQSP